MSEREQAPSGATGGEMRDVLAALDDATSAKIQTAIEQHLGSMIRKSANHYALWMALGNNGRQNAALVRCKLLIAWVASQQNQPVEALDGALIRHAITEALKHETLIMIEARAKAADGPTLAFFLPTLAFAGHFGSLGDELRKQGVQVFQIFGSFIDKKLFETADNFLVIGDMIRHVKGVDGFLTAQILDTLPRDSKKILLDHLSFVNFNPRLGGKPPSDTVDDDEALDGDALVQKYTAFPVFFPLYDVHVTASHVLTANIERIAKTYGYRDSDSKDAYDPDLVMPHAKPIMRWLGKERIARNPVAITGGYPKLDSVCRRAAGSTPEKLIVYAPTPNDKGGNKSGSIWQDYMSINSHGADIIHALCENFPDYHIVFKPHAEEFENVVERIVEVGVSFDNFELSRSGSDYWELYMRAQILVSDFSSTAYTYAIGTQRPVIFFSKNEAALRDRIDEVKYCYYRDFVGEVAENTEQLCSAVTAITSDYETYLARVRKFVDENCVNPGHAAAEIAAHLADYFAGKARPEWRRFQLDRLPSGEKLD
jgi:hypothetical protein